MKSQEFDELELLTLVFGDKVMINPFNDKPGYLIDRLYTEWDIEEDYLPKGYYLWKATWHTDSITGEVDSYWVQIKSCD